MTVKSNSVDLGSKIEVCLVEETHGVRLCYEGRDLFLEGSGITPETISVEVVRALFDLQGEVALNFEGYTGSIGAFFRRCHGRPGLQDVSKVLGRRRVLGFSDGQGFDAYLDITDCGYLRNYCGNTQRFMHWHPVGWSLSESWDFWCAGIKNPETRARMAPAFAERKFRDAMRVLRGGPHLHLV